MQPDTDFICACLRGESPEFTAADDADSLDALYSCIEFHGIGALLHSSRRSRDWPAQLFERIREQALQQGMWELRHQQVLAKTLAALDAAGIHPVLIKGTALAYSIYSNPAERSRGDTDLIVPFHERNRVDAILASLGYDRALAVSGTYISYQSSYTRQAAGSGLHVLDVHWKISNSEVLSQLFTYEELWADGQPLPSLSPHARAPSPVRSLLLACMHRCTHRHNPVHLRGIAHYEPDRLIWLYDIHLLSAALGASEWNSFTKLAAEKGLRAACLQGLQNARSSFGATWPDTVQAALAAGGMHDEASGYLESGAWRQRWLDFRALGSVPRQLAWTRELLFPSRDYMRQRYPNSVANWLPWLYLQRAATGLFKRLAGSGAKQ